MPKIIRLLKNIWLSLKPNLGISLLVSSLFVLAACASNPYPLKDFNLAAHGSEVEEWSAHREVIEWWYLTAVLFDEAGNPYCVQFTVFHGFQAGFVEGFVLHLALTDVKQMRHSFYEAASLPGEWCYASQDVVAFNQSRLELIKDDRGLVLQCKGKGPDFSFQLLLEPTKPAVWHGQDGIIVMGWPEKSRERSFYYSFTSLKATGKLVSGQEEISVSGTAWFDRQWGQFSETAWDWFSLRLSDGRQIMLFAFPKTGFKVGTLVTSEGQALPISSFDYQRTGTEDYTASGIKYRLGWRVVLQSGEEFRIQPLLSDQYNPAAHTPAYWEGLAEVLSATGEKIGYAVVETTTPAQEWPAVD